MVMSDHMMHHPLCFSYCTVFVLVNSYELRESGKILSSALMKWYCSEPLLESLCECICDSLWLIDQGKSHSSESGVISASSLLTEQAGKQTYLHEPFQCRDWKYWRMNTLATHFPIFKQEFCNLSLIFYNVYSFLALFIACFYKGGLNCCRIFGSIFMEINNLRRNNF